MIGYLSPRHGYLQWCESLGGDYYRISDAHPDPTMHGLILFVGERQALKQVWSAYFDVEVVRVEFDMHRYFSSFYYVRGRKRA
jgi:hypothetical protein